MKIIGVTGNSGSGKSFASSILLSRGCFVIDLDKIGHSIYDNVECLYEIDRSIEGDFIVDGKVNRKLLGNIVFNDAKSLKLLTSITDKYIYEHTLEIIKKCKSECVVLDGALIFDSKVLNLCDDVILITSNIDERIKRIIKRDNITKEYAYNRVISQKDYTSFEYSKKHIITNDSNEIEFKQKVDNILNDILEKSE